MSKQSCRYLANGLTISLHGDELEVAAQVLGVQSGDGQTVPVPGQRGLEVPRSLLFHALGLGRRKGIVPHDGHVFARDASALCRSRRSGEHG